MSQPKPADNSTHTDPSRPAPETLAGGSTGPVPVLPHGSTPHRVGRFEIRGLLGEGAFARVFLGFDPELEREVAIKVPKVDELTPEFSESFLRENRLAAIIHHPNVCPVYEVGTEGHLSYIVMRVVRGTLAGLLKRLPAPMAPRPAVAVARKLAQGLAAAHAQKVIHRDLKPANVLYDEVQREVLIADFGLARFMDQGTAASNGVPKGTPAYMAPEQARGLVSEIGPESDVYALGVILYELLVGRVPFKGSVWEVMRDHCETPPPAPSRSAAGVDARLDAIVLKALAKKPADRYRTAKEFAAALNDYLRGSESGSVLPPSAAATVAPAVTVVETKPPLVLEDIAPEPVPHKAPPRAEPAEYDRRPVRERPVRRKPSPREGAPASTSERSALPKIALIVSFAVLLIGGLAVAVVVWLKPWVKKEPDPVPVSDSTSREETKKPDPLVPPVIPAVVPAVVGPKTAVVDAALRRDWDDYVRASGGPTSAPFFKARAPARWRAWKTASDADDVFGMVLYANCLESGDGAAWDQPEAARLYRKAADRGEAIAMTELGHCYRQAKGVPKDEAEAVAWYRKAAALQERMAMFVLGRCYKTGSGVTKDEAEAVTWFRKAADLKSAAGMLELAYCYRDGRGVTRDDTAAATWFRGAADLDDPAGMHALADCLRKGQGLTRDYAKAREWYEKAAGRDHAAAQYELGDVYYFARSVTVDYVTARGWYEKAAAQGHAEAQYSLGVLYNSARGVTRDYVEARGWYEKAAAQGSAASQDALGDLYASGLGVTLDYTKARGWYEKAAAQGNAYAQTSLGGLYENGRGVTKDAAEAVKWYRKAAALGNKSGMSNLARCYEDGVGVTKSATEAAAWRKKALDAK